MRCVCGARGFERTAETSASPTPNNRLGPEFDPFPRQDELQAHLIAAPAANWHEAAEKARYLLDLFAATLPAQDPRRQTLIAAVHADFQRLSAEP
jgi:hypothetical protein